VRKKVQIYSVPEKYFRLASSSEDAPSESPPKAFPQLKKKKIILWIWSIESSEKKFFSPIHVLLAADQSHSLGFFSMKILLRIVRRLRNHMAVFPSFTVSFHHPVHSFKSSAVPSSWPFQRGRSLGGQSTIFSFTECDGPPHG